MKRRPLTTDARLLGRALDLTVRAAPGSVAALAVVTVVVALGPAATVWLTKVVVDRLAAGTSAIGPAVLYGTVLLVLGAIGGLWYFLKFKARVVDELVVNMVDVGEETGELDTMLYKVADTYDDEVKTMTDGLMAMMEPLMIVFLGGAVGFIVIALFMPLISLITQLS